MTTPTKPSAPDKVEPGAFTNIDCLSDSHLLTDEQAAAVLDTTSSTLSVWRCTGRYNLPFVKIGRKVRYRAGDLRAFLAKRTVTHTGKNVGGNV